MPNVANPVEPRVTEATRVPLSVPTPRLAAAEIPGYHTHWFLGRNVPAAKKAGYEFVETEESVPNQKGVANDLASSGSSDMGTRVSVLAGGVAEGSGDPERLYLMKLRQEWRDKDVKALEAVNERIAQAIRGGNAPDKDGRGSDPTNRYLKKGQDLFIPRHLRTQR